MSGSMPAMNDAELLSIPAYAEHVGKTDRTVRRWLTAGQLPGARKIGREWWIPRDTVRLEPEPGMTAYVASGGHVVDMSGAVADLSREVAPAAVSLPAFWFTVDDVAGMWAPLVSRHAIRAMIRNGELPAYRRGPGGSWVIPAAALRAIAGGQ